MTRNYVKLTTIAIAIAVGMALPASATALDVQSTHKFEEVRSLTPAPDGHVWFFARTAAAPGLSLYRIRHGSRPSRVRLPGFRVGVSRVKTIAIGPDARVWVAVANGSRGTPTTIYRIKSTRSISRTKLRRGISVNSMAAGSDDRMWFLGYGGGRVGYVSNEGSVGSKKVVRANALEELVLGADGRMWASGLTGAVRFGSRSTPVAVDTQQIPSSDIARGADGAIWLPGVGAVQRISPDGTVSQVPLVFPTHLSTGGSHVNYPFRESRASFSVFSQRGAEIGFTSGAIAVDNVQENVEHSSVGSINGVGVLSEEQPWQSSPQWYPDVDAGGFEGRTTGSKLAVADTAGNRWLVAAEGLVEATTNVPVEPGLNLAIDAATKSARDATVRVTCTGPAGTYCAGTISVRSGGERLASRLYAVAAGTQLSARLRIAASARKRLRNATVTATLAGGNSATSSIS